MNKINDGGPAFPTGLKATRIEMAGGRYEGTHVAEFAAAAPGMTLRDYFAAKAMAGMLAYPGCESRGSHHNNNTPDGVAAMAYEYANAMLRARGEA
ncbi:hypothetical protein LGN13_10850 [Burkholderia multivorans]|nr:hypothetical protein [Burkholderia multivorans]